MANKTEAWHNLLGGQKSWSEMSDAERIAHSLLFETDWAQNVDFDSPNYAGSNQGVSQQEYAAGEDLLSQVMSVMGGESVRPPAQEEPLSLGAPPETTRDRTLGRTGSSPGAIEPLVEESRPSVPTPLDPFITGRSEDLEGRYSVPDRRAYAEEMQRYENELGAYSDYLSESQPWQGGEASWMGDIESKNLGMTGLDEQGYRDYRSELNRLNYYYENGQLNEDTYRKEFFGLLDRYGIDPVVQGSDKVYFLDPGVDLNLYDTNIKGNFGDTPGMYRRHAKTEGDSMFKDITGPVAQIGGTLASAFTGNPAFAAAGSAYNTGVKGGDLGDIVQSGVVGGVGATALPQGSAVLNTSKNVITNLAEQEIEENVKDDQNVEASDYIDEIVRQTTQEISSGVDPEFDPIGNIELDPETDEPIEVDEETGDVTTGVPQPPEQEEAEEGGGGGADAGGGGGGGGEPAAPEAPGGGGTAPEFGEDQGYVFAAQLHEAILRHPDSIVRDGLIEAYEKYTGEVFDPDNPPSYEQGDEGEAVDAGDTEEEPPTELPDGYEWVFNPESGDWELEQVEEPAEEEGQLVLGPTQPGTGTDVDTEIPTDPSEGEGTEGEGTDGEGTDGDAGGDGDGDSPAEGEDGEGEGAGEGDGDGDGEQDDGLGSILALLGANRTGVADSDWEPGEITPMDLAGALDIFMKRDTTPASNMDEVLDLLENGPVRQRQATAEDIMQILGER